MIHLNLFSELLLRLLSLRNCDCTIVLLGQLPRIDHLLEDGGSCTLVRVGGLKLLDSLLESIELRHLVLDGLFLDECFLLLLLDFSLGSSPLGTNFEEVDADTIGG